MIQFSKQDEKFIKENFENWEELLQEEDVNRILLELHLFIDREGFDKFYNLNDLGREAQRVYDSIYRNN
ncbi:hypothetical protein [Christensenella intestinihominis]|uniref:hypothetical protein n=1 Tax=Christensenella intestinihominis TaxID=1851429 RepID=UPI00082E5388|nr:hypothetical protein [Christensenella intestinihominis]